MIEPPPPNPASRLAVIGILLALVASVTSAVVVARYNNVRDEAAKLRAELGAVDAELRDLKSRLQGDVSGGVLDRILRAVSRLRSLTVRQPVKATLLTIDQLRTRVVDSIEKDSPRAEIERTAKVLRTLGLLTPAHDLYKILLDVHTEQIAGFYDPETKEMVVGGDAKDPSPLERVLLAHEYTHALTDQHFSLSRLEALNDQGKDDEALAYLSLIEGDATVLMGEYARQILTASEQAEFSREANAVQTSKLDQAPAVVRTSLLFPYDEGVRFVRALFEAGGNAAIDRAYRQPPTSTEQILHPERYVSRRDDPVAVTVPDLATSLGSGWKEIDEGGIGEMDVRMILDQYVPTSDANDAAAGWDGGRYRAVESSAGVVFAGLTAWDSTAEARDAADEISDWIPERFGRAGSERRIPGFSGRAWSGPAGAGEVVRDRDRVLFLLCPTLDACEKARQAFGTFGSATA